MQLHRWRSQVQGQGLGAQDWTTAPSLISSSAPALRLLTRSRALNLLKRSASPLLSLFPSCRTGFLSLNKFHLKPPLLPSKAILIKRVSQVSTVFFPLQQSPQFGITAISLLSHTLCFRSTLLTLVSTGAKHNGAWYTAGTQTFAQEQPAFVYLMFTRWLVVSTG